MACLYAPCHECVVQEAALAAGLTDSGLKGRTILQIVPELETGGAERTAVEIAAALTAAGARAIVVSEGGPMVAELEAAGGEHVEMPAASKNPVTMIANIDRLKRLIRAEGVDIVHARSRAPAWSALAAARACGVAFITTYHGIYKARGGLKRAYNSVMARGDYVIANSGYTKGEILAEHAPAPLADPDRLVVIPRGADLARFSPEAVSSERVAAMTAAWGGEGRLKILLPGRLTGWKGQKVMIEAARILRETRQAPDLRIVLAGSDQGRSAYRQELIEAVEQAELGETVSLPGNCADMPAAFLWSDLAVSASIEPEAFGRVAIEAQAMARPVIASDHGGARETVADGVTGWLVPPGEPRALAEAIARYGALGPQERRAMGQAARDRVIEMFSLARMTGATLDLYVRALGGVRRQA